MIGIICIATTLILDERKSTSGVNDISGDLKEITKEETLTDDWQQF